MSTAITVIHVLTCLFLILVILLQAGKGADMGNLFGGGGSQSLFGSGGAAPFLVKMTSVVAAMFMLTSLSLAVMALHPTSSSLMEGVTGTPAVTIPVTPVPEQKAMPQTPVQAPQGAEQTVPQPVAPQAKVEAPQTQPIPPVAPVTVQPVAPVTIPAATVKPTTSVQPIAPVKPVAPAPVSKPAAQPAPATR